MKLKEFEVYKFSFDRDYEVTLAFTSENKEDADSMNNVLFLINYIKGMLNDLLRSRKLSFGNSSISFEMVIRRNKDGITNNWYKLLYGCSNLDKKEHIITEDNPDINEIEKEFFAKVRILDRNL